MMYGRIADEGVAMVTSGYLGAQQAPNCDTNTASLPQPYQDQAVFEADKRAVYKHPLFPLLALLYEKCELATQLAELPSPDSFQSDIQAFVQHQNQDHKPFFINDHEVDELMIKAIQVLRIHLLELEKVQELCKDFCSRYIMCLKGKMQSENLLRGEFNYDDESSPPNSPVPSAASHDQEHSLQSNQGSGGVSSPYPVISNQTASQMSSFHMDGYSPGGLGASSDEGEDIIVPGGSLKRKQKRGVLPKHATTIMRSWLFQHIVHPYPTEDEKRQIAAQTNLTLLQVNNWFINARRRILQPMLDASYPEHKNKKQKHSLSMQPESNADVESDADEETSDVENHS